MFNSKLFPRMVNHLYKKGHFINSKFSYLITKMKILGIIPARGGSKGIPQKSIRKIGGKPLIQYSIEAAKKSKINKIIVSTDDQKIAKIAKKLDIEIPFLRPKEFSKSSATTISVITHTLRFLKENQNYEPDIIVLLQPTSPLRTATMIDKSIFLLKKQKASSVITVSEIKTHPFSAFTYNKNFLKPFRKDFAKFDQRQQYSSLYFPTGSIYTFWNKTLQKSHTIYGTRIIPIISDQEISVDIDTQFDFFIAEMTMLHWKKYTKKFST